MLNGNENTVRTINGKPVQEIFNTLANLISIDDYSPMEKTGHPYIPTNLLQQKFMSVVGFNLRQEPFPVGNDSYVSIIDVDGQQIVNASLKLSLYDDDGILVTSTARTGATSIKRSKETGKPINIEADIKSAETESFKRGIYSWCPKPEEYEELKKSSKKNSNGSGNQGNTSEFTITFDKAANLISNGMITGDVTAGQKKLGFAIFSNNVKKIAENMNLTPEALVAKFSAGVTCKISGRMGKYNNQERIECNKVVNFNVTNQNTQNVQASQNAHSNVQNVASQNSAIPENTTTKTSRQKYDGLVSIAGPAVYSATDGSITVPVVIANVKYTLRIENKQCQELADKCSLNVVELAKCMLHGQAYNISGVAEGTNIKLINFREGGR